MGRGQSPTPQFWGLSGLRGAGEMRGRATAAASPQPRRAQPKGGGQNPPQQRGRQVDAHQHEDLGERPRGARARASRSGAAAGPSAAPRRGGMRSPGTAGVAPRASRLKQRRAAGACVPPRSGQSRGAFPERLEPRAGGGRRGGASGRLLASPAVLGMGWAPRRWPAGVPLLRPPTLLHPAPGVPSPGAGERREAASRSGLSGSQTARRGAAAEEPVRPPGPDGSQGPGSGRGAEQEQPPREARLRPWRARTCKAPGRAAGTPLPSAAPPERWPPSPAWGEPPRPGPAGEA